MSEFEDIAIDTHDYGSTIISFIRLLPTKNYVKSLFDQNLSLLRDLKKEVFSYTDDLRDKISQTKEYLNDVVNEQGEKIRESILVVNQKLGSLEEKSSAVNKDLSSTTDDKENIGSCDLQSLEQKLSDIMTSMLSLTNDKENIGSCDLQSLEQKFAEIIAPLSFEKENIVNTLQKIEEDLSNKLSYLEISLKDLSLNQEDSSVIEGSLDNFKEFLNKRMDALNDSIADLWNAKNVEKLKSQLLSDNSSIIADEEKIFVNELKTYINELKKHTTHDNRLLDLENLFKERIIDLQSEFKNYSDNIMDRLKHIDNYFKKNDLSIYTDDVNSYIDHIFDW